MTRRHDRTRFRAKAFTLVELLLSMTILVIIMLLLTQVLSDTQKAWSQARARTTQYREARTAFESMSRRLTQATLNSYWGYRLDANGSPTLYERQSELQFLSGPSRILLPTMTATTGQSVFFQAPLCVTEDKTPSASTPDLQPMEDLLNAWGYYVEYNSDLSQRPEFLKTDLLRNPERKRFRLMEYRLPSEKLDLYRLVNDPAGATKPKLPWIETPTTQAALYAWFSGNLTTNSQPLADNILAVIIQPVTPTADTSKTTGADLDLAPDYLYDTRRHQWASDSRAKVSRHQLPPELRLTLIALDEAAWQALSDTKQDEAATQLLEQINSTWFKSSDKFQEDLQALEKSIVALRLNHRVFSTAIPIRAARWTTELN